jgi:hypothetical protein
LPVRHRDRTWRIGFSGGRLVSSPNHALMFVAVGQTQAARSRVDGGTKMIVADAAAMHASPATHNLAIAGIAAALAGKPALLGYISGWKAAWGRFVLQNGGQYLFVSGNGPGSDPGG